MKTRFSYTRLSAVLITVLGSSAIMAGCAGNNGQTKPAPVTADKPVISQQLSRHETKPTKKQDDINKAESEKPIEIVSTERFPQIDISEAKQPEKDVIQFGFDKHKLSEEDTSLLKKHAKYLVDHPQVMVEVIGHTDRHGPRSYNEYLSKKRAEAVTAILLENGVSEAQIVIKAMADSQPLADAKHARDNRRVEMKFQKLNLVSN